MIVAIASDDGMRVAEHPSRCGGFVVFEVGPTRAVRVGYRSNACCTRGGEVRFGQPVFADPGEIYHSLVAALSDCNALVSHQMDDGLIRALQDSVIEAYVCGEESVDQAAQSFVQGHLRKLKGRDC
jgi:predicted Fe-Mo cluster-binding NifX family protein